MLFSPLVKKCEVTCSYTVDDDAQNYKIELTFIAMDEVKITTHFK